MIPVSVIFSKRGKIMDKITLEHYEDMVRDIETPEIDIVYYSIIIEGEGGFDFRIEPDPSKVEIPDNIATENAVKWANEWDRRRRRKKFYHRLEEGAELPILVSEGDSWFQYPIMVTDIIDHLKHEYLIYSVGAAGDTLRNMVRNAPGEMNEYLEALNLMINEGRHVSGFLFSGAGNDIIGNDPDTGEPALKQLLKTFNGNVSDVQGQIDLEAKAQKLNKIEEAYVTVITSIQKTPALAHVPIFIHGYDNVFPFPYHGESGRRGFNKRKSKWLGGPLDDAGIKDKDLRRNVIMSLIADLNAIMLNLEQKFSNVYFIDCRGSMPNIRDWNDEIHGTSDGFAKVARRFKDKLDSVIHGIG